MRSPAGCVTSGDDARSSPSVCSSRWKPRSSSNLAARSSRRGSSTKTVSDTARTTPAVKICPTAVADRADRRRPTGTAIALNVKSRVPRSASIPLGSGVKSTVSSAPSATTRHAPCRSDNGNGAPPKRLANRFAAARGSRQATSMSSTRRPSRKSRTAPPTIHASSPDRISAMRSSFILVSPVLHA